MNERHELPGARPRSDLQPGRPGQSHRQHAGSLHRPRHQLSSQLSILEACRRTTPRSRCVVRRDTRSYTAATGRLPVDELHLVRPMPTSTASTRPPASTTTCSTTTSSASARVAPPDQRLRPASAASSHNRQGFIGWFIRLAIEDARFKSSATARRFATSSIVDDAADAFLRAGACADACDGEVFNVGGRRADESSRSLRYADSRWPAPDVPLRSMAGGQETIDIGSFYSD